MQADGSEAGKLLVTGPRLIELAWAKASPETPRLWPYTVQYSEGLSQAMQLLVHCISLQGPVAVQALVGRVVALGVAHDGTRRWLGGVISRARVCGEAAGRPMLALHVESALSLLDRRTTCRVFQDLSVPDIVATVLDEHRKDNAVIGTALTHGCALTRTYPPRSYCVQFNESGISARQVVSLPTRRTICRTCMDPAFATGNDTLSRARYPTASSWDVAPTGGTSSLRPSAWPT